MGRNTTAPRVRRVLAGVAVATALVSACSTLGIGSERGTGDNFAARQGKDLIDQYGCGSCHTIPGVRGADGLVAPPLTRFGQRAYIAGSLTNTLENLARWIANPDEVEPGTAMPDLGVSEEEAASIAAYLHTLD